MLLSHGSDRKTFGDIISSQPMRTIGLVASLLEVSLYQGQVHLIVHSWLLFRFSLTFIYKSMRQAMKQCNSVRKDEEVYDHNIWTCYYRTRSQAIKIKLKCIISFSEWYVSLQDQWCQEDIFSTWYVFYCSSFLLTF